MKRAFIRTLWGEYDKSTRFTIRRFKTDRDINNSKTVDGKFNLVYHTYVLGKDNYEHAKSLGVKNLVLVDDKPLLFDTNTEMFGNKLFLLNKAMEDFDEVVYLDWDCNLTKALPDKFWKVLSKKREIQSNLQQYKRPKCTWRKPDIRKASNGGFLYIRDKNICDEIFNVWQNSEHRGINDEMAISFVIDSLVGGWKGMDVYWDNFEPMICDINRVSCYKNKLHEKDICFRHYV